MATTELIANISRDYQDLFQKRQVILSFGDFLQKLKEKPTHLIRNSASYIKDTFAHFGTETVETPQAKLEHFKMFDLTGEKTVPIIGCDGVHDQIFKIINAFARQGFSNKLILLHGPNGSAKTSTVDAVSHAMHMYSETEDGAVYKFNWIFPTEKTDNPRMGEAGPIGFGGRYDDRDHDKDTYALLDESKIASKIHSEFRDNPFYLIPMPQREKMLRRWIATEKNCSEDEVEIPPHALISGLSKKNQLILENLLTAYDGDYRKAMRHVQVERFFYSKQYRVGIATVEPQMSIDAIEKQLTMDKNISNLPSFLHNIRFHEAQGPLIEANRGLLEFSDILKRPVEAFKYLLTSVEKETLNLPSSTANLDIVFVGTTNEKHLDAFKTIPDFSSFRSRFELVTIPYLLEPSKEIKIYERDVASLAKTKPVCPHTLELLCIWAVMTRLKQPDPDHYDSKYRALVARLDPRHKIKLYEGRSLQPAFKSAEESLLKDLRSKIYNESQGVAIYEGRFGASPREIRGILQRASENPKHETLTPMAIFDELKKLVRDKTVYEFLQFEPRGKYHDAERFIQVIEEEFIEMFNHEALLAMTLVEESQYDEHLQRYIDHVVAFVKKEKIYSTATSSYEDPSTTLMKEVEKIIGVTGSIERHRQSLLARIAAYKIENPDGDIDITEIFQDLLRKIQDHYHGERKLLVDDNFKAMLKLGTDEERNLKSKDVELAHTTFEQLEKRFGYDRASATNCLKFLMTRVKRS